MTYSDLGAKSGKLGLGGKITTHSRYNPFGEIEQTRAEYDRTLLYQDVYEKNKSAQGLMPARRSASGG